MPDTQAVGKHGIKPTQQDKNFVHTQTYSRYYNQPENKRARGYPGYHFELQRGG